MFETNILCFGEDAPDNEMYLTKLRQYSRCVIRRVSEGNPNGAFGRFTTRQASLYSTTFGWGIGNICGVVAYVNQVSKPS